MGLVMAMLSIEQVAASLARKYTSNAGFFELCSPKSYPYEVSLSPPSSKFILENFAKVRQWQQSFEESPYRSLLVKTDCNHRVLGAQRIISKLRFNTPFELEDFVLKFLPTKERSVMVQDSLEVFGGPAIKRGTFNAYYVLCQLVASPCYGALDLASLAFKERLSGIQYFMQHNARKAAILGSELIIAVQFVDFLASLPATPHLYLRQFSLPHMHSKFLESNYVLLDQLLTYCLPLERQVTLLNPKPEALRKEPISQIEGESSVVNSALSQFQAQEQGQSQAQMPTTELSYEATLENDDRDFKRTSESDHDKVDNVALSAEALEFVDDSASPLDVNEFFAQEEHYSQIQRFLLRWGFKVKPDMVRLRSLDVEHLFWLDPRQGLGNAQARSSELAVEIDTLNAWRPQGELRHVIICENEICYLSLPSISHAIAIWGSGYKAVVLGRLALLVGLDVVYWGDLDTHGFAILNQLRVSVAQHLKQHLASRDETLQQTSATDLKSLDPYNYCLSKIRSILMDVPTIEANIAYAVNEARPFAGRLPCLTHNERQAYRGLLNHLYGHNLRIEQEFIPFDQLINALKIALPEEHITVPEHYCQVCWWLT